VFVLTLPSSGATKGIVMRRVLKIALATAAIGLTASAASAQVAEIGGTTIPAGGTTIFFGGPAGTTATSSLFLKLTGANSTTGAYTFDYTFTNTNASVSNLVNFGFTTNPALLSITGTSGMNFYANPINFPGGYRDNACAGPLAAANCDAANGQGDLFSGAFTLNFAGGTSTVNLDGFVVRYASLCELANCPSGEGTPVRSALPEPATWALRLLGFGGFGLAMRRRRSDGRSMQVASLNGGATPSGRTDRNLVEEIKCINWLSQLALQPH
jgi:hypothetical protein